MRGEIPSDLARSAPEEPAFVAHASMPCHVNGLRFCGATKVVTASEARELDAHRVGVRRRMIRPSRPVRPCYQGNLERKTDVERQGVNIGE